MAHSFIPITITADSSDTSAKVRRGAIRVDQIIGWVDVTEDKFMNNAKTRLHLVETLEFDGGGEGACGARLARQVCVQEDVDTIQRLMNSAWPV
jgi:hypothetical protein